MTKLSLVIAVAMAFVIAFTVLTTTKIEEEVLVKSGNSLKDILPGKQQSAIPTKRVSRFLAEENPRPKFHCNKDNDVCLEEGSPGSTCCNNKCVDIMTDNKHCGGCKKNKCKYTESCCNGECVNMAFDKRHCGNCNNKCMQGGYCIYGMCDYA